MLFLIICGYFFLHFLTHNAIKLSELLEEIMEAFVAPLLVVSGATLLHYITLHVI